MNGIQEVSGSIPLISTKQKQLALLCELFLFGYKSGGVMALASYAPRSVGQTVRSRLSPSKRNLSYGNADFSSMQTDWVDKLDFSWYPYIKERTF